MLKKLIFIAGELPFKRVPSYQETRMVAEQLEALIESHCKDETIFALCCDTTGPKRVIESLGNRIKLKGIAASRALNYNKSRDFNIDEEAFLSFLQEHVDKASVLVICTPTHIVENFIETWARSAGHQPVAARTLRYGTIHVIDTDTGRVRSLIA